jgi:hypothetical protein
LVKDVRHNTIKPEDYKMKTNRNFNSKLSKVSLTMALAFSTLVSVSCQNVAHEPFSYKTDFIKQMVYQVSTEFMTCTGICSLNKDDNKEAASILVNYNMPEKKSNYTSANNNNDLADFLTKAAQMNAPVATVKVENDNTLDFLIASAQLNSEVAQNIDTNDDTLEFLINAAQLNAPVANEETSQDNLLDFLTQAAHLNDWVAE